MNEIENTNNTEEIVQSTQESTHTVYSFEDDMPTDPATNENLQDNINTEFKEDKVLTEEEEALLSEVLGEVHNEIPINSKTSLIHETTSRFSSAIWYEEIQRKTIVLAGVGGIGSYVGFLLSRMRPNNLFIYDPDIVETVNMSGQMFRSQDVGVNKVDALSNMIKDFSDYHCVYGIPERFDEESEPTDIMICGFDNMAARKTFFNKWRSHVENKSTGKDKCLFIDGRLAAEEFQVLCIKGDDTYNIDKYEKEFLFTDAEADATICSYKQTTFMANMIGSIMVNLFVNFVANQCNPLIDRDLPFYTEYNAETMYFKTIS